MDDTCFDVTGYAKVTCNYYKASGKYYASGKCYVKQALINELIYPGAIGRWMRDKGCLPGLASGRWEEFFTVRVDERYTELVVPA